MEKESKYLEYKEVISKTYLKTVCAFSNYNDGTIVFGITDDYKVIGISDPIKACLNIKNQINDSIKPKPEYSLKINDNNTISLFVKKGFATPYRYNGKCYKRNDSSTIEVDSILENRLVLEGINKKYEELSCGKSDLTFEILSKKFINKLNLSDFNTDTLKSLNLYSDKDGYNNAALLLADTNDFAGLDFAVFGDNYNEFRKRISLQGNSILKQYDDAIELFKEQYIIERIEDGYRKTVELIPFEAYREAVANAIIHRVWDIKANTKIEMHKDKIIVSSPGGLLPEMSKEDYLRGNYSYLRNPIIANVFYRLEIVEIFATGIRRINEAYKDRLQKPIFEISDNAISITLPVEVEIQLTANEKLVYELMQDNNIYSRSELENLSKLTKSTIIRIVNSLLAKELIIKKGAGKSIIYYKK